MFSLSGTYDGYYVCDSTVDGVSSTWGRPIAVSISDQQKENSPQQSFTAEFNYTDDQELGSEYTLYNGQYALSAAVGRSPLQN